jgi:putative heme-binding domain-containing protein
MMIKVQLSLLLAFLSFFSFMNWGGWKAPQQQTQTAVADTLPRGIAFPDGLQMTPFAGPQITPSPAVLAVSPTGEVFVGVDKMGSLGKEPGKGSIVKLTDSDNDGKMDKYTEYAKVNNPRGIIANGDQLFVLHAQFSDQTGKATGMDLVVFEDKNHDGIADGPSRPLIENISSPKFIQERGVDHATNGIRMGIDGWIYIAVGDFGFYNAVDRDGTKLTMHGGGILRVRPDGTEMEVYTHGMRNIYDVAIDPYLNIFTRGNTNDGGGWNIRFSHHIQSGEYGYPLLFKNFTEEILPGLADLGGGSGTGALFMDEPTWPEKFNQVPMMADWGNNKLYIHRVVSNGASFTQQEEDFIRLPQITDLDVDGSGRLFLAAWDGAGYSGSPDKGFIVRVVPKGWSYKAFPDLKKLKDKELTSLLKSPSAVARLAAQQELLTRPAKNTAKGVLTIATDRSLPLSSRVAAIFTYAQITGEEGLPALAKLEADADVREFALRAMADRRKVAAKAPIDLFVKGMSDSSPRVQAAAIVGLGRTGRQDAVNHLLKVKVPASFKAPEKGTEGPHATPNPEIIHAHLAVQALVGLNAVDACLNAIDSENSEIALWALRYMHDAKAVDGLIAAYGKTSDQALKAKLLTGLARLYKKEAPYRGHTWWSTRPDGHGPYYEAIEWEESAKIKDFLSAERAKTSAADQAWYADLNEKFQMGIAAFGPQESQLATNNEPAIDLTEIQSKQGQIGETSIEDVMLAIEKIPGDPAKGKAIFQKQGCGACHSLTKGEPLKGPFMGQVGSIMNREQIAESILKPNASISQGFASVLIMMKNEDSYMGFITSQSADRIALRDIAGQEHIINTKDIASREELEMSMMPAGLANSLSIEEFASLVTFLEQQK